MSQALADVIAALGQPAPPKHITQQPFDYNPGHYRRLCRLEDAASKISDLSCYVDDMCYMPLQPDLLRFLLPFSQVSSENISIAEKMLQDWDKCRDLRVCIKSSISPRPQ